MLSNTYIEEHTQTPRKKYPVSPGNSYLKTNGEAQLISAFFQIFAKHFAVMIIN